MAMMLLTFSFALLLLCISPSSTAKDLIHNQFITAKRGRSLSNGTEKVIIENPLPLGYRAPGVRPDFVARQRRSAMMLESRRRKPRAIFQNVYYEGLGKFDAGYGSQYFSHHYAVPDKPENVNPTFLIFTPDRDDPQIVDYFNLTASVKALVMDFHSELYVAVHGFRDSHDNVWFLDLRKAIVDRNKYGLMIVGWPKGSQVLSYYLAAANTRLVGKMLANVLQQMDDYEKAEISRTTIIGHSLGSHIAGFAGAEFNGSLYRIIGLDPAGPLFNGITVDPHARLDPTDAQLVQAIHSNGENLLTGGFGQLSSLGHIDFYPNGGANQPGCNGGLSTAVVNVLKLDFTKSIENLACSHGRVIWLFIEMMNKEMKPGACRSKAFPNCDRESDWLEGKCFECPDNIGCPTPGLGLVPDTPHKGKFYYSTLAENVTTGEYCGEQYRIEMTAAAEANGEINMELEGMFGIVVTVEIQRSGDTLKANQTRSRVFVAPWSFVVQKIRVDYSKYISKFRSGAQTLHISRMVLTREDGYRFEMDDRAEVEHGQVVEWRTRHL